MAFLVDRYAIELVDPTNPPKYAPGLTITVKDGLPLKVSRAPA